MKMTEAEIRHIIEQYYPEGLSPTDEGFEATIEYQRLIGLLENRDNRQRWDEWVDKIRNTAAHTVLDLSTYSFSSPCQILAIGLIQGSEAFEIKIAISAIAPVFCIKVNSLETTERGISLTQTGDHIVFPFGHSDEYVLSNLPGISENLLPFLREILEAIYQTFAISLFPPALLNIRIAGRFTNAKKKGEATMFQLVFRDSYL